jgi:hypothetical protein
VNAVDMVLLSGRNVWVEWMDRVLGLGAHLGVSRVQRRLSAAISPTGVIRTSRNMLAKLLGQRHALPVPDLRSTPNIRKTPTHTRLGTHSRILLP